MKKNKNPTLPTCTSCRKHATANAAGVCARCLGVTAQRLAQIRRGGKAVARA